jgi:hypothetical protein
MQPAHRVMIDIELVSIPLKGGAHIVARSLLVKSIRFDYRYRSVRRKGVFYLFN